MIQATNTRSEKYYLGHPCSLLVTLVKHSIIFFSNPLGLSGIISREVAWKENGELIINVSKKTWLHGLLRFG